MAEENIQIALDSLSYLIEYERRELVELLQEHWVEVAKYKRLMKLSPHFAAYLKAEKEGRFHVVTARSPSKLVGYSAHWIIKHHPHYHHMMVAEDDVHYLIPELRGTGLHERMRCFALQSLKMRGVHFVTARTKVGHGHESSLVRIGYAPLDVVYGLNLLDWEPREERSAMGSSRSGDSAMVPGPA